MIMTGGNRSARRNKTGSSTTLFTTKPIWAGFGLNPGFRGERSATNRLSHGADLHASASVMYIYI